MKKEKPKYMVFVRQIRKHHDENIVDEENNFNTHHIGTDLVADVYINEEIGGDLSDITVIKALKKASRDLHKATKKLNDADVEWTRQELLRLKEEKEDEDDE